MLYVQTSILPTVPYAVLRGAPFDASGVPFDGRILINLGRSLKVQRINVAFQSVSQSRGIIWSSPHTINSQIAIEHELFNAAEGNNDLGYQTWTPSKTPYELPFSFLLPGYLHDTVRTPFGNIEYEIKVTIHSCGYGINTWTQQLNVPVYRIPKEGTLQSHMLYDSLSSCADWLSAVELHILSDTMAISDDSTLRVRVILRPLVKGQLLSDVGLRLYETITCAKGFDRFGDPLTSETTICHTSEKTQDEDMDVLPLCQERCFNLSLKIPSAPSKLQFDMKTAQLLITHELALSATVLDSKRNVHYLRTSTPIHIVPRVAIEATSAELPAYSQSSYDRLLLLGMHGDGEDEYTLQVDSLPPPPQYCQQSTTTVVNNSEHIIVV